MLESDFRDRFLSSRSKDFKLDSSITVAPRVRSCEMVGLTSKSDSAGFPAEAGGAGPGGGPGGGGGGRSMATARVGRRFHTLHDCTG